MVMMKQFDATLLLEAIADVGLTEDDFIRRCIKEAPAEMSPDRAYIKLFLEGKMVPGTKYLCLMSEVLVCPIDSFFSPRPKRRAR
jgi:hypothetical protein